MKRSWIGLDANRAAMASARKTVTKENVKLCALCGTLNHAANAECWTCRWHGGFSHDERTVALAWQRLESQYEEVRLEHVTSQKMRALGDFGAPRSRSYLQTLAEGCRTWWSNFQNQRDLRMAARTARLRSRLPSRTDHLGV